MKRTLSLLILATTWFPCWSQDFRNRDDASGRINPNPGGVQMGVRVTNREFGVEITQVIPGSPGAQIGLEPGDVIITVGGYQVGYVNGRLYDLGEECNRRMEPNGNVRLVVRNQRTGFLANLNVVLGNPFVPGPMPPPNPGWGQGVISGTVSANGAIPLPPGALLQIRLVEEGAGGAPPAPVAEISLPNVPGFPVNYQLPYRPNNLNQRKRYFLNARVYSGPQVLCQTTQPYWFNGGSRPIVNMVVSAVAAPPDQGPVATITQWYRIYLGREPDPQGLNGMIQGLQQGQQTMTDIQVGILSSAEFYDRCNNNPQIWVNQLYTLALNQRPKPSDIDYWSGRLNYHKGNRPMMVREFLKAASGQ